MSAETQRTPSRRAGNVKAFLTKKRVEMYTTVLLAMASLLAAWCAYQASAWNGEQSEQSQVVARQRLEATRQQTRGGQLMIVDVTSFTQWLQAYRNKDTELATFLRNNFRRDFLPAFEAWVKLDPLNNASVVRTPFELSEYSLPEYRAANKAEAKANEAALAVQHANDVSDEYVRETLFTAVTLFLGAMAGRFEYKTARWGLLGLATVVLIFGLVTAFSLPII